MLLGSNIVCGIDGFDASVHACNQVVSLLGGGPRYHAISVLPEVGLSWAADATIVELLEKEMNDQRKLLKGNLDRVREAAEAASVRVDTLLDPKGHPWERIVDLATSLDADLIVLGARNREQPFKRLVGTETSRVIGYTNTDVLLVPESATLSRSPILVPVDGSKHALGAAKLGVRMAQKFSIPLHFTSVAPVPKGVDTYHLNQLSIQKLEGKAREALEEAEKLARSEGAQPDIHARAGEPAVEIAKAAREIGAGVVVMGSHGRTGLRRLLMGSTTEKMLQSSPCAVLVTKP